jgi:ribulose-bisphosphate carboxylase small chain
MKLTQGQFSFLPPLTDEQILAQIKYALNHGWSINVEFTDNPHPRNTYWEMWGLRVPDLKDPDAIMHEINECRKVYPNHYVRVTAIEITRGMEIPKMSYIVNRPPEEPDLPPIKDEGKPRNTPYTIGNFGNYSTGRPGNERY